MFMICYSTDLQDGLNNFYLLGMTSFCLRSQNLNRFTSQVSRTIFTTTCRRDTSNTKFQYVSNSDHKLKLNKNGHVIVGMINPDIMNRLRNQFLIEWSQIVLAVSGNIFALCYCTQDLPKVLWTGSIVAFTLWTFSSIWYQKRSIGMIALKDPHTAVISTMNYFGRRVDKEVHIDKLSLLSKTDHKARIDNRMYFLNWEVFKVDDKLWGYIVPSGKKQLVLQPKSNRTV